MIARTQAELGQSSNRTGGFADGLLRSLGRSPASVVASAFAISFVVVAAASGPSLFHPYVSMDDLIWEIDKGIYYATKLPAEGRWAIYGWTVLVGLWSAATSYVVGLAMWCLGTAFVGQMLAPAQPLRAILSGVALASCPAMLSELMWPHTTLPIFALFAAGMALIWFVRQRIWLNALALFVACAFAILAYQTLVLLILSVALLVIVLDGLRSGRSAGAMFRAMILPAIACVAGGALGLLISFALNLQAFHHFGLVLEPWRLGHNQGRSRLVITLRNLAGTGWFLTKQTYGALPALLAFTFGTLALSALRAPTREAALTRFFALFILLGICGAIWAVVFLTAVPNVPSRCGVLIWLAVIAAALACDVVKPKTFITNVSLVMLIVIGLATGAWPFFGLSLIQQHNDQVIAKVGADLARAEKPPITRVYVVGGPVLLGDLGEAGNAWGVSNLIDRDALRRPLAIRPIYCRGIYNAEACGVVGHGQVRNVIAAMPAYPSRGYLVRYNDLLLVKLGPEL